MSNSRSAIVMLALLLSAAACVSPATHRKVLSANEALQAKVADLSEYQRQLSAENERLRADVDRLSKSAADREDVLRQKAHLEELIKKFEQGGVSSMPGVEFINTGEGPAFRVAGSMLFASGKAEVTEAGRAALKNVIDELKQNGRKVRVNGYTDDQPIVNSGWKSNLELSAARALSVADFLIKSGVAASNVAVGGYGEFVPAGPGTGPEADAKNRRVEILMTDRP